MTNYNLFNDLKIKHKTLGHSVTRVSVTASVGQLSVHQHCWVVSEGPGARAIVAACNYTKVWAARGHGRYWLLQPITISARHNITHPQFQQARDLFSTREYLWWGVLWGVMNAATQHFSLLLLSGRRQDVMKTECTLQILSESCNLNCFESRTADTGSAGSAAGGQNLNQSSRRRDGGQSCDKTKFNNSKIMSSISCGSPRAAGRNNIDRY